MFEHLIIQFKPHHLSSGRLREVKNKRTECQNFRSLNMRDGRLYEVPDIVIPTGNFW